MRGEAGFLLTQLSAAAAFLASCDASQLKGVDEAVFARAVGVEAPPAVVESPPPTPEDPRWPRAGDARGTAEVASDVAELRLSETSAALRTEFTFAAAPAAEPPAEPTADQPPDPPASPKRSYEEVNGPVPTGPVIDENGLAQQVREEDEPLRGSLLDPEEPAGTRRGGSPDREAAMPTARAAWIAKRRLRGDGKRGSGTQAARIWIPSKQWRPGHVQDRGGARGTRGSQEPPDETRGGCRPGGASRRPDLKRSWEPVLEPLVAEPRLMFFLHDRAILEQRLAHHG